MPSTYSPNLRIELIANGEQSGTWGTTTNSNLGTLIEDAISGYVSVSVTSANQALTAINGAVDQSRNMVVNLTTTTSAAFNVYIPPVEKFYVIRNASAYDATIFCSTVLGNTTAAGTGVTVLAGTTTMVFSEGTNVSAALTSFSGNLVVSTNSTSPALRVTQVGSGDAILVEDSANPDSTPFVVTSTGDVGIGKTTPTVKLDVVGTINASTGFNGTVGATTPNTGAFTTLSSTGNTTIGDASTDTATINAAATFNANAIISVNSTSDALRITQVGTGNALLVEDSANPDATPFVIDANGRVISGATALPAGFATAEVSVVGRDTFRNVSFSRVTANATSAQLYFQKARGTFDSPAIVQSGDNLALINCYGFDGSNAIISASINAAVDGTPGTNDMPGRLVFSTTPSGSATPTERMRIDSAGRFGFGTTTLSSGFISVRPNQTDNNLVYARPTIQSGVTAAAQFNSNPLVAAGAALTTLSHFFATPSTFTGTVTSQYGFNADSNLTGATNNYGFFSNIAAATGRWNFYANGTAANYFAGNVGIGTSSPSELLSVIAPAATTGRALVGGGDTAVLVLNGDRDNSGDANTEDASIVFNFDGVYNNANNGGLGSNGFRIGALNGAGNSSLTFTSINNSVDTERMRIDSSGNVGFGTSSPAAKLDVRGSSTFLVNATNPTAWISVDSALTTGSMYNQWNTTSNLGISGTYTNHPYVFVTNNTERMRIDSSGNVGIGTSSPGGYRLNVNGSYLCSSGVDLTPGAAFGTQFNINGNGYTGGIALDLTGMWIGQNSGSRSLIFACGNNGSTVTERARIDTSGNLLIGKTAASGATAGAQLEPSGLTTFVRSGGTVLQINRLSSDGNLIDFYQDTVLEGNISVSGNTVSYNAFAGSHWSQLQDGSKPEILRGTVMESIDELVQWPDEPTTERLCRSKVSDTAGSKRVYGVFMCWDEDWTATNDMLVTSLGAFICRVNAGVTVQMGDLLESNGDGTARVQADDIIRSSTIGKVTGTAKTHEYDDGSYCVPTVLYCG
jgi:hypothetical protein